MRKMIQRFWMIDDHPPANPGCFVIPSYALKDSSLPTRPTRAQIKLAFEWWKKFPTAKLIMSTGDNQGLGITNSRVMAEYAISLGLPRENVIEEDRPVGDPTEEIEPKVAATGRENGLDVAHADRLT